MKKLTRTVVRRLIPRWEAVQDPAVRYGYGTLEGSVSIGVNTVLFALKLIWGILSGSISLIADGIHTLSDVLTSIVIIVSFRIAGKPSDETHPFGHGKIEFFSAGFEGALIILAAFGIFKVGIGHLLDPHPLPRLGTGLAVLLGTAVVNLLLGIVLLRLGKKTGSLVLEADGQHILTDVYTSGGVLAGLFLAHLTGWLWLDGTLACLMGLNILWTGLQLVRRSFAGLMDAMDPALIQQVVDLVNRHRRDEWIDIHNLRAWRSGRLVHIDLHLILRGDLTLDEAHTEAVNLEKALINGFAGNASVLVHMDPCIDQKCAFVVRGAAPAKWRPSDLTRPFNTDECKDAETSFERTLCGADRDKKST